MAGNAPQTKELPDGTIASIARVSNVAMRTVECTDGGETMVGGAQGEPGTHVKVQVKGIDLKESHKAADGLYSMEKIKMTDQKHKENISMFNVEICGETYDLMSTEGKLQFILAKNAETLPMQALLSLRYTSPMGGQWYVDKEPVNLQMGVTSGSGGGGCCVVM